MIVDQLHAIQFRDVIWGGRVLGQEALSEWSDQRFRGFAMFPFSTSEAN